MDERHARAATCGPAGSLSAAFDEINGVQILVANVI
jgi:hypothetical protein